MVACLANLIPVTSVFILMIPRCYLMLGLGFTSSRQEASLVTRLTGNCSARNQIV
jgi:hypothetical protein